MEGAAEVLELYYVSAVSMNKNLIEDVSGAECSQITECKRGHYSLG
jgi:hypothetical protein